MTNAELIKALRNCEVHGNGGDCRKECPYVDQGCGACNHDALLHDAADALEAAEKRIAELERILKAVQENSGINFRLWQEAEAQLPKEGEWIESNTRPRSAQFYCSVCHRTCYDIQPTRDKAWAKRCRYRYCPNCGARMKTVTDCHTLEDGER